MSNNYLYKALVSIAQDQYHDDLEQVKWFAMIISYDLNDTEYYSSDVFWWHCKQLKLTPSFVLKAIDLYIKGKYVE
tara:strand:+ start:22143 stop:22370 length:228 start_codon:yes stop_codon:yes gene_type:complete